LPVEKQEILTESPSSTVTSPVRFMVSGSAAINDRECSSHQQYNSCFSTSITIDLKVTKELLLRKSLWMWNFGSHWPPLLASTIKGSMSTTHTLIGVSHTWTHLQSAVVQWSLYNYSGYPWDTTNWLVYSGGLLKQNTEYHYHVMQVYHTAQAQILLQTQQKLLILALCVCGQSHNSLVVAKCLTVVLTIVRRPVCVTVVQLGLYKVALALKVT